MLKITDYVKSFERHYTSLSTTARYLQIAGTKVCATASPLDLPDPVSGAEPNSPDQG